MIIKRKLAEKIKTLLEKEGRKSFFDQKNFVPIS